MASTTRRSVLSFLAASPLVAGASLEAGAASEVLMAAWGHESYFTEETWPVWLKGRAVYEGEDLRVDCGDGQWLAKPGDLIVRDHRDVLTVLVKD